jgi:diguanylate cyclase (GGDEF)-like protein
MPDTILADILNDCLALDREAGRLYSRFSLLGADLELKDFWRVMSEQESEHVGYWQTLLDFAGKGMLPQVFECPARNQEEIRQVRSKIELLRKEFEKNPGELKMFQLAFRCEFYLLNPTLISLLHYLDSLPTDIRPQDHYTDHLNHFILGLKKFGTGLEGVELLGEALERLWEEQLKLAERGDTDYLTGLANRRGLFNLIRPLSYLAQRRNTQVGIMIIDVDGFKAVNDRFGHQKGDQVLAWVANTLRSSIRRSDVIGRYGGEEFLLYIAEARTEDLRELAEKLRKTIEVKSKDEVALTISIGAAVGTITGEVEPELESLLKKADDNLLKAKAAGKNQSVI